MQRLKAAIWHYAKQIVEEESETLQTTATPQFVSALADLVYAQARTIPRQERRRLISESVALDLESFALHAKRSVVNVEDVKVSTDPKSHFC